VQFSAPTVPNQSLNFVCGSTHLPSDGDKTVESCTAVRSFLEHYFLGFLKKRIRNQIAMRRLPSFLSLIHFIPRKWPASAARSHVISRVPSGSQRRVQSRKFQNIFPQVTLAQSGSQKTGTVPPHWRWHGSFLIRNYIFVFAIHSAVSNFQELR
jgi:hypothetical protein